jgi:IMP dehydrogenase
LLAGTDESPGDVFASADGRKYKVYRGMASVEAQVDWRGHARSLEGITTTIPYKGSVKNILKNLEQNIKSGLSYTGARTISEFQASARFIQQTNAGQLESGTHILNR